MPAPAKPLAITLGDPAGVGPELICEAWTRRTKAELPPFFAVGGARILEAAAAARSLDIAIATIAEPAEAVDVFANALPVLAKTGETADGTYSPGEPSETGAAIALRSLQIGTRLAREGLAGGVVTGPIDKAKLGAVGFHHPGQTEFVAHECGIAAEDAVMMLAGPSLRAVPLTVHIALADVPQRITAELICRRVRVVDAAMRRDFGIAQPRIAVAALNPHAGEKGRMGDEEERIIIPAIAALREEGIDATGPHPGDTLFAPRSRETYDVAIAMYHDQALIPLKALDFDEGVNVTLGLPIVRTSPDHGTAFNIAGQGIADAGATIAAIRMAGEITTRRAANG